MEKIKISFPAHIQFETELKVRISDLNYGAHVGNNIFLEFAHEARVQYLNQLGCKGEIDLGEGAGIIMVDAAVVYKAEVFHPMELLVQMTADHVSERSFDLFYRFLIKKEMREAALIKTGIVCFDYQKRRPANLPTALKQKLESIEA
ncbi:MAG: thioesterase family protein [Cyclobacteriaceae bacterium]|nr:thioesterase family protein [Cyclobacteriaceae bacterium]